MISFQQIRRHDRAFIVGHGSKGRTSAGSGLARCISRGVRDALQEFIDVHAVFIPCDACYIQIHVVDFRRATCGVDYHVCFKCAVLACGRGLDSQAAGPFLYAFRLRPKLDSNAQFATSRYNLLNQVRIKKLKWTRATMQDGDLRAHARGHMGKLKGDVSASNKKDSAGKLIELQELFARRKEVLAGDLQVHPLLPRRDDDKTCLQPFVSHLNCVWPDEMGAAVECHDARSREAFFTVLGNGLRESALEAHQFTPINRKFFGPNAIAFHPAGPVDHFRGAYQHLFRIASRPRAGPAERPGINYRDLPSFRSAPRSHRRYARSRSDRHDVKLFGHFFLLEVRSDWTKSNYFFEDLDILIRRLMQKSCANRGQTFCGRVKADDHLYESKLHKSVRYRQRVVTASRSP